MKKHTALIPIAALGLSTGAAALIGVSQGASAHKAPATISAPLRTELLPGIPAPATAGQLEALAAAASKPDAAPVTVTPAPHVVTSFTTTAPATESAPVTPAPATTDCYVTWTGTQVNPVTGQSAPVTEGYGDDSMAACQAFAAQQPGATISTVPSATVITPAPGEQQATTAPTGSLGTYSAGS